MNKSIFFMIGIAVLVIPAFIFVFNNESQEDPTNEEILQPHDISKEIKLTGTPADNYSLNEREQHCGSPDAKSNNYIQEFEIPTECSQPSSIVIDSNDKIWFVQSNTGSIANFDPLTEKFTEYENEQWNLQREVMLWGMVYTDDNEIWFTDEINGVLWKFSITEETYSKIDFPKNNERPYPQKMSIVGNNFLINDFSGNQVVLIDHNNLDEGILKHSSIIVPEGLFTSQAAMDSQGNVWFVMWKYQKEATLVKVNSNTNKTEQFELPHSIDAPNGLAIGPEGNIWIADAAGNSFYKFIPEDRHAIEFITTKPAVWSYGNSSGLIKTPITRPYWNAFDYEGNMWFNQQTANRLAVFEPYSESLIEYDIPSKNPKWSDCGEMKDCGIAQSFGFAFLDDQVWFTEWVENNIGVLDTSVTVPVLIQVEQEILQINQGEQKEIFVSIMPHTNQELDVALVGNTSSESIKIETMSESTQVSGKTVEIPVTISVSEDTDIGIYKILIGTQLQDVVVSSYITVRVT